MECVRERRFFPPFFRRSLPTNAHITWEEIYVTNKTKKAHLEAILNLVEALDELEGYKKIRDALIYAAQVIEKDIRGGNYGTD